MKINVTSLSLQYTAEFRTPFFRIADARTAILETLYRTFAEYLVKPEDLLGFGGNSLGDQRARLNLFRGNAYVEISAQKVFASFQNAVGKADVEIIDECIARLLAATETYATDAVLGNEQILLYPAVEMESQEIRDKFLRSLPGQNKLPAYASRSGAVVWPNYRVELEHPSREWLVIIDIQRAWALPKNLFVNAQAYFYTGASSLNIKDKSKVLGEALFSVFEALDLQAQA